MLSNFDKNLNTIFRMLGRIRDEIHKRIDESLVHQTNQDTMES